MPQNVALVSGGLDSAVLLWLSKPNVKALLFDYGQRHRVELDHAWRLCDEAGVSWDTVDLRNMQHIIAKGSQTGPDLPPEGHYTEMSMKTTIVPNRNAIMLSIAVGHAIAIEAKTVAIAAHAGDHTIYPDCRLDFIKSFDLAMQIGNAWTPIDIAAPFIKKTKTEIVQLGHTLGVPFARTWSCYTGGKLHCGRCGTCVERKEAFQLAGVEDPTQYA